MSRIRPGFLFALAVAAFAPALHTVRLAPALTIAHSIARRGFGSAPRVSTLHGGRGRSISAAEAKRRSRKRRNRLRHKAQLRGRSAR